MSDNNLDGLNDILFDQMSRLTKEGLDSKALKQEIDRAEAVTKISTQIVANASLCLKASELAHEQQKALKALSVPSKKVQSINPTTIKTGVHFIPAKKPKMLNIGPPVES